VREAALQAHFSELSFLFDISTQLQLRLDLNSMLELAAQRLLPCLDAHQSSIMLLNEETGLLEVRAASGVDAERVVHAKVAPGEGVAGQVFTSGEVLNLTAASAREQFANQPDYGRQIAAGLCVPMRFRGNPIGVVCVTRTTGEPFSDLHARMLASFAEHCAATVVKTNHHHDLLTSVRKAA
jgi:signal transduction protein with GAF and PtsI domain